MARELVEWDDVGADEGYRVQWGTASGAWNSYGNSADTGTDVLYYTIIGLTEGVTYYWRVCALVGGVEQTVSSESSFVAHEVAVLKNAVVKRLFLGAWA